MENLILVGKELAATMTTRTVSADTVNGCWCHSGSDRQISFNSPSLITPGGKLITGDSDRHGFRYDISLSERPTGEAVTMVFSITTILRSPVVSPVQRAELISPTPNAPARRHFPKFLRFLIPKAWRSEKNCWKATLILAHLVKSSWLGYWTRNPT